jgi:LacI family transcriptional regulator
MTKSVGRTGSGRGVTIKDIARLAGVSIKTVSRVMNGEPNVHQETKARVAAVMRDTSYKPHPSARNLARTRSHNIALLYDNPSASYIVNLQQGVLEICREEGFHLLIRPCQYRSPSLVHEITALVLESRIGGLILSPPLTDLPKLLAALEDMDLDYVQISPLASLRRSPAVAFNDRNAAYDVTSYLIGLGHKRIAFIKGHPDHGCSEARLGGYLDALQAHGSSVDEGLITQGLFSFDSGVQCGRLLLTSSPRPTAIFASNDDMAAGALQVAHSLGIPVPTELSVVGYDDTPLAQQVWPSLTTVRQPIQEMARAAAVQVVQKIRARPDGNGSAEDVTLDYSLIVRDSTAPAP